DDRQYRKLGGTLQHVLDGILRVFQAGMWLEIVTLVVPGMNDSADELRRMARFIAGVSRDIPWHVTAFHPDYHMRDTPPTPPATLMRAYETGREEGLNFVYAGNLPGRVGNTENTICPRCGEVMVERFGNRAVSIHLRGGCCPGCQTAIPGRWEG
ncbi:MAG: hypothetical protein OEW12_08720, partial [Deltaproteobacteria bacterium]|nr:hypothetical protein [Deltaproteobacteria bacterium]